MDTVDSKTIFPQELLQDRYWRPLWFLFSRHYKLNRLLTTDYIDLTNRTIAVTKIKKVSAPWSQSEKFMLNLALHLFNSRYKVDLGDMDYLDASNKQLAIEAIKIRYC